MGGVGKDFVEGIKGFIFKLDGVGEKGYNQKRSGDRISFLMKNLFLGAIIINNKLNLFFLLSDDFRCFDISVLEKN